jgi:hypothetical protein
LYDRPPMTLVNAWWQGGGAGGGGAPRNALVQCDGCLPPLLMAGTEDYLSARGWVFDELEGAAHFCPFCAGKARDRGPRRLAPAREPAALPNLLIIGAAKCGTGSLRRYLALHPEIFMSVNKELNFFQDPGSLDKLDTYATFFDGSVPVRGEASTVYTHYPLAPGVAERVRAAIPDVKLVYLVRDPVDRAISHYLGWRSGNAEFRPLEEATRDIDNPYNPFIAAGRYATQLEQYKSQFEPGQLLVIEQNDLLLRRRESLRRVFRFLGVDEEFVSPQFDQRWGTRESKRAWTGVGRSLAYSRLADAVRALPPGPRQAIFRPIRKLTTRKLEAPQVNQELRRRLEDAFREEVERFRDLTGLALADWAI